MGTGLTVLANGLLYAPKGIQAVYWQSGKATKDGYRLFRADQMLYLMPKPDFWVRGQGVEIKDRKAWLSEGLERDGLISDRSPDFLDPEKKNLRLKPVSPAARFGSPQFLDPPDAALRVARDFNGTPRPSPPAAGAFEPAR
jgi:hypothetical protein